MLWERGAVKGPLRMGKKKGWKKDLTASLKKTEKNNKKKKKHQAHGREKKENSTKVPAVLWGDPKRCQPPGREQRKKKKKNFRPYGRKTSKWKENRRASNKGEGEDLGGRARVTSSDGHG